ncbi:aldo/keto reductase [Chloroflexota bacterium]
MGKLQANQTPEEGARAIRESFNAGVNFYDTAQGYGTYPHLALGLKGISRDKVVIASKSHARSYDAMKESIDECLRELELERVDIFNLHLIPDAASLKVREGALKCLVEYKEQGKVGAIGASTHTVSGVEAINDEPVFDVVFPVLNRHGLGIIDGNLEDMLKALEESKRKGLFVYAMKPLGGGHLHKEVEESLAYLRELPVCDAVAIGMKDEAEVRMNVAIFNDLAVGEELKKQVSSVDRHLTIYDRCTGCGLCVEECDQGALTIVEDKAVVDNEKCIICGYCAAVCPEYVIRVV